MFRVILKDRGQITIPAKVRKNLTLVSGDILEVEVKEGYIILKPLQVLERGPERPEDVAEGPAA